MLELLYEDSNLIVIDKPPNIHSVINKEDDSPSIAKHLKELFPSIKSVSPHEGDSGLVNRLDFETSGLLLAAKSREYWEFLHKQFVNSEVTKRYLAVLEGEVKTKACVEGFIGSRYRGSKKVDFSTTQNNPRSLWSSSIIEPISIDEDNHLTLSRITITTGRRHQIRVHCASLGHPLMGDSLYGSSASLSETYREGKRKFYLHAESVTLHISHNTRSSFFSPTTLFAPKRSCGLQ